MENNENKAQEMTQTQEANVTKVTEKDRWMLAAVIFSAVSTAITAYFSGKK